MGARLRKPFPFHTLRVLVAGGEELCRTVLPPLESLGAGAVVTAADIAPALDGGADFVVADMGGLGLIRQLRQQDGAAAMLPVLVVTAADAGQANLARNAGANGAVAIPLDVDELRRRISAVMLNPVPFVRAAGYFGPDRRRVSVDFDVERRRARAKLIMPTYLQHLRPTLHMPVPPRRMQTNPIKLSATA